MEFDTRVQPKAGRNSVEIDGDRVTAQVGAAQLGRGVSRPYHRLCLCIKVHLTSLLLN